MAFRLTVNLGNSIIGVSILTMPYCFRRCGILLSIVCILTSGLVNRAGCHLLFRCAVMTRKRSFEDMALQVMGPIGKLVVELCVLAFLLGTCVAYFVVIGDLGPSIVSDITGFPQTPHLRAFTMTFIGMFIALPLALLRRVDSLSALSAFSFAVYLFLATKLMSQASVGLLTASSGGQSFVWWNSTHLLQNMPIFAMSLSCQTQLFELFDHSFLDFEDYDVVSKLDRVVRRAVHLCSLIYVCIGLFGYVAFHDLPFGGNILSFLPASVISTAMKMAFVATVAVSLPLCLFPCRTSLFSLMIKSSSDSSRSSLVNEFVLSPNAAHHMSDRHFRLLTVVLIVLTVCISIVVPRIEFVLSIVGSTTGTIICFILPAVLYCMLTRKNTAERLMARAVVVIGLFILVICTMASLNAFADSVPVSEEMLVKSTKDAAPDRPVSLLIPDNQNLFTSSIEPVIVQISKLKDREEELLLRLKKNQEQQEKLIEKQRITEIELKSQDTVSKSEAAVIPNHPVVHTGKRRISSEREIIPRLGAVPSDIRSQSESTSNARVENQSEKGAIQSAAAVSKKPDRSSSAVSKESLRRNSSLRNTASANAVAKEM